MGLPAMLKGWFDRVWAKDVAFALTAEGRLMPLMAHIRKIGIITTCGAPWWLSVLIGQPGRKMVLRGIRALCGLRCKTMFLAHYLMDTSTPESRVSFLGKVRTEGGDVLGADAYILTRSAFGSYIGFSDASAAKRSPAISIS